MTDAPDIAGLREMLAKATERPWKLSEAKGSIRSGTLRIVHAGDGNAATHDANFELIVALANSVELLLDRQEAAEAALRAAEELYQIGLFNAQPGQIERVNEMRRAALTPEKPDAAG